jgi:hypothetical protein
MLKRAQAKGRAVEVNLSRPGRPGAYNPETGEVEGETPATTYTGVGVKIGYEQDVIDGTRIRQGDQQLYADAVGLVRPASGETINAGSAAFTVVNVEVVAPGAVDVLYIIQVRGLS